MPTKKRGAPQASEQNYRVWRKRLKEAGFFGKRTSLKAKVTPAQKRTINRLKDVATGNAHVFKLPKKQAAQTRKLYGLKGSGENVIVKKHPGERISFSKKRGEITISKKGRKKIFSSKFERRVAPPGKRLFYTLEFNRGEEVERYRFEDFDALETFMAPYEHPEKNSGRNPWPDWRAYVIYDYLDNEEITEAREEGDRFNPRVHKFERRSRAASKTRSRKTGKRSGKRKRAKRR